LVNLEKTVPVSDNKPILLLLCNEEQCFFTVGVAPKESGPGIMVTMLTVIIVFVVLVVVVWLLFLYCRSKRNGVKKVRNKDHELDSMKSAMESMKSQNQAPPPYTYASTGMENKALEHSMDLPLTIDDSKNGMYSTQGGYGYRSSHGQLHPGQNMPNSECKYLLLYKYFIIIISLLMSPLLGHRPSLCMTHKENESIPTTRTQVGGY
jgi:hypothetical protein